MSGRTFTDEELDALENDLQALMRYAEICGKGKDPFATNAAEAIRFLRAGGWRPIEGMAAYRDSAEGRDADSGDGWATILPSHLVPVF